IWDHVYKAVTDPTVTTKDGQRYIEIDKDGQIERLVIDGLITRAPCAGRATACWKAHREEDPGAPLVIKDSWQDMTHDEGEFLREATDKGVVNVARYYYHATVQVHGEVDTRGGLDSMTTGDYQLEISSAASLPSSKRSRSASRNTLQTRVYRRVILRDYGRPIYEASTRPAFLAALEGCISGHESLHRAGILHRDIPINNLMINEDEKNPSWPAFLIDLDLAIRDGASKTDKSKGTRAFMAIGALMGEQHSFMHDLESFFWVIFWICIHYEGPSKGIVVSRLTGWNYMDAEELACLKTGVVVVHEGDFFRYMDTYFTAYYQPLIPWVNRLRQAVFPNGLRWVKEDRELYARMKAILRGAQEDPDM
ncbi:hypothetical protein BO94DRAFT_426743, partial [Aspergillus sclerotioniger CBS 115572]